MSFYVTDYLCPIVTNNTTVTSRPQKHLYTYNTDNTKHKVVVTQNILKRIKLEHHHTSANEAAAGYDND